MSERTTHQIVCIGLTQIEAKKKLVPVFKELRVDGTLDDYELSWDSVKASPGNVYSIDASEWAGGSHKVFVPKGGRIRWERLWPNREDRARWEADAEAAKTLLEQERLRTNAERQDELLALTKPLSDIYHSLPWAKRTAFLVHVQELITQYKPKKKG